KNGAAHRVAGFTPRGGIRLENGWEIASDAGLFRHGVVETSFGSQGRTVQRVLLGMSAASLPATNQEQMYVSASRGRERLMLYTDSKEAVRDAIQRTSQKRAALDLRPPAIPRPRRWHRLRSHMDLLRRLSVLGRTRAAWDAQRYPERPTATHPTAQLGRV